MGFRSGKSSKRKSIWLQIRKMREVFPDFEYKYGQNFVVWIGNLTPSKETYSVRIRYDLPYSPLVHVLKPEIREDAPHVYHGDNNALCLHYPYDNDWSSAKFISDTIVPWTVEWLWYYENWCITGQWFGEEAPHRNK